MVRPRNRNLQGMAAHGRVPYSWGGASLPPGQKPHSIPAILNQPLYNWWVHEGREQRAAAYAEALRAVGVDYAPQSTFAHVQHPGSEDAPLMRGAISNT